MTAAATTLVVGAGGLLGQHVRRQVPGAVAVTEVPWLSTNQAKDVLHQRVRAIVTESAEWNVAWCA
jgi:hypothetical protein